MLAEMNKIKKHINIFTALYSSEIKWKKMQEKSTMILPTSPGLQNTCVWEPYMTG